MEDIKKTPKNTKIFCCDLCDFKCFKQSDLTRHIILPKHLLNEKRYKFDKSNGVKTPQEAFQCECGKSYKYSSGLWRHKKICENTEKTPEIITTNSNIVSPQITPELIIKLIEQNKELL